MLSPKRAKYRKSFRGKRTGLSVRAAELDFGDYGLKAMNAGWISSRQIEAARKALTFFTKKGGRIWIRIFPDKPVSKKPAETRMGSGKGDIFEYVAVVRPGRVMFEMAAVTVDIAREAMNRAAAKLPISTKFITRN